MLKNLDSLAGSPLSTSTLCRRSWALAQQPSDPFIRPTLPSIHSSSQGTLLLEALPTAVLPAAKLDKSPTRV